METNLFKIKLDTVKVCTKGLMILLFNLVKLLKPKTKRAVVFDLKRNPFGRHLYCFMQIFKDQGYTIVLRPRIRFLGELYGATYTRKIFSQKFIFQIRGKHENSNIRFTDSQNRRIYLNPDYFSKNSKSYKVPISMHPVIYTTKLLEEEHLDQQRLNAVFFAGNFEKNYDTTSLKRNFGIENRVAISKKLFNAFRPQTKNEYYNHIGSYNCVLINRESFYLNFDEYFTELRKHTFFLACPGIIKPTAHNLIEAIYNKCIPIIQKKYAQLITPALQNGVHCIYFDGLEDLQETIETALSMKIELRKQIRQNLVDYYNSHLSPRAIVKNIVELSDRQIYLEKG